MHTEHDTDGAASPFRWWFLTWELLFLAFLRQRTSYISYKKHVLKLCRSVSISDPADCLSLLLCQQCLTEPFHFQGRLEPEKVPVAIRAAGVDADGLWTKQNLAQIIWYFPLTTYKQHLSHSAIVLTSARQHHCALPPGRMSQCQGASSEAFQHIQTTQPCLCTTFLLFSGCSGSFPKKSLARNSPSPSSRTLSKSSSRLRW